MYCCVSVFCNKCNYICTVHTCTLVLWEEGYFVTTKYPSSHSTNVRAYIIAFITKYTYTAVHKQIPVTVLLIVLLCPMNSQSLPFLTTPLSSLPVTTVPRPREIIAECISKYNKKKNFVGSWKNQTQFSQRTYNIAV